MKLSISVVEKAWGWTGLHPKRVLEVNAFGNVLILDNSDRYWRICPEEPSCVVVADNPADFAMLRHSEDFKADWEMVRLHQVAVRSLGRISGDRVYCLKIPAVLGGAYEGSNIGDVSIAELILASGDLALQTRDLPNGSSVQLKITK